MFKALMAGAVAIGLMVAPTAAGAMSTHKMSTNHKTYKTHKMHHAQKKMTPGTTTGMSGGMATEKRTGGTKAKSGQ
jgi:sterol desaturase/sphingolipid hydroxylase (fatty acid hydroxylase superfamily)